MKKKVLIFTGAGVSKESGIETFRDSADSLWNNHRIEDVATIDAWRRNRELVLDFYNARRSQLNDVRPNLAHEIIADLENDFDVTVVTQNVDDLHERAGSTKIVHLHGELRKSRSTFPGSTETYDCQGDINLGDKCSRGAQLRPHIVWFGENLDAQDLEKATDAANDCDICIIVGTSLQVYPASQLPLLTKPDCDIYYVDPGPEVLLQRFTGSDEVEFVPYTHVKEAATTGMAKVAEMIR